MSDFLVATVDRYKELAKVDKLKKVGTPFLDESGEATATDFVNCGVTVDGAVCKKSAKQRRQHGDVSGDDDCAGEKVTQGVLQPIAARVLMKLLYAARMARFDLLRATCGLACCVTKWDAACDARHTSE